MGQCALDTNDGSGLAYGLAPANTHIGPAFGYQASGLGSDGRVWKYSESASVYGYWGRF